MLLGYIMKILNFNSQRLTGLVAAALLSTATIGNAQADSNSLNYNVANLQAQASRQVSNDEMYAVLYIEKNHKQPAELSSLISQQMNQAMAVSKKYAQVKVKTGSQNTYPVYDNDNRKLREWRGRAEIIIESQDFKAASQLIAELQNNFQTQSIQFSVSEQQRKKVENELIVEASQNFQRRAQQLSQAWQKTGFQLINLDINTQNQYPQPMRMQATMAKAAAYDAAPQEVSAGESKITVNANGSIQFK